MERSVILWENVSWGFGGGEKGWGRDGGYGFVGGAGDTGVEALGRGGGGVEPNFDELCRYEEWWVRVEWKGIDLVCKS